MPTRRLSRVERAAQTRAELLVAARQVFARRGYASASVSEIAEVAGYSHGAVYSNFDGKQDLFLALFEEHIAERVAALGDDASRAKGDFAQRASAVADGVMDRARKDPDRFLLHLEFVLIAARDPALRQQFAARFATVRAMIAAELSSRHAKGKRKTLSPEDMAMVLDALAAGLAIEHVIDPDAVRDGLFGDFVELFI